MGLLNLLFGSKNKSGNKSIPFHRNKSDAERREWFAKSKPWDTVDDRIIDALIEKFGNNSMFEVFVITSLNHNLVQKYAELIKDEYCENKDLICSLISKLLYDVGSASTKLLIEKFHQADRDADELTHHYKIARDTFETALIVDENQVSACYQLAIIMNLLNKKDEALQYAQQSLSLIKDIQTSDISSAIPDAQQTFDEMEKALKTIIAEVS